MMYTYYNGLMTILIDTAERMHEFLAHLKELNDSAQLPSGGRFELLYNLANYIAVS